jgi:hypothetical protein
LPKTNPVQRQSAPAEPTTPETPLTRAQADANAAERKLADRAKTLADADSRVATLKARIEDLRPEAADGDQAAIEKIRQARQAALDVEDERETARVGVERARQALEQARAGLQVAQRVDTAARYEQAKAARIEAAVYVDRAVAGLVQAARHFLDAADASGTLHRDLTGRDEPRSLPRLDGAISAALHAVVPSVALPQISYRKPLAEIERVYAGLAVDPADAKRRAEEALEREAAHRAAHDADAAERERQRQIRSLQWRLLPYANSGHPEAVKLRAELAALTGTTAPTSSGGVVIVSPGDWQRGADMSDLVSERVA